MQTLVESNFLYIKKIRMKAELLVQVDGANSVQEMAPSEDGAPERLKLVTVVAATNNPWD